MPIGRFLRPLTSTEGQGRGSLNPAPLRPVEGLHPYFGPWPCDLMRAGFLEGKSRGRQRQLGVNFATCNSRDVDPSTGDTGPPRPRRPDVSHPNLFSKQTSQLCTPFSATPRFAHPSRTRVFHGHESTRKHTPPSAILVIHGPLSQPHPTKQNKLHSPPLSPFVPKVLATVHFISFLLCRLFPLKYFMPSPSSSSPPSSLKMC